MKLNNHLRKAIIILLACFIMCAYPQPVHAATGNYHIVPYHLNVDKCNVYFYVQNDVANIIIDYFGKSSTFLRADVTVKIQKRFLLTFWKDVDIGCANNEWKDSSIFLNGTFSQSFAVDGSGYYRALITVKFYGTTGVVDTVEFTEEFNYN